MVRPGPVAADPVGQRALSDTAVTAELTRNLEDNWKPIIDADVDGPNSLPRALDDEFKTSAATAPPAGSPAVCSWARRRWPAHRTRDSTPPGSGSVARCRGTVAIYGDALNRLADRATYFYVGGGRYWYEPNQGWPAWHGTEPSVSSPAAVTRSTNRSVAG